MATGRFSRRKLLATAPVAGLLAGCRKKPGNSKIEARFVGQNPERGHKLRSGELLDRIPRERISTEVLIVGGGVAGATAAWRLRRAGLKDLHLVELEDAVGGTARGSSFPRSAHPLGAHYLPTPHRDCGAIESLLEDLGIVRGRDRDGMPEYDTTAILPAPLERHHYAGRWFEGLYPAHGQTPEEERQWELWLGHLGGLGRRRGADGRRLFALPVAASSTELRHLDQITMADYLDQIGITSWRVRWIVDYACRDDYGCRIHETSAFAGLHHFLARGIEDEGERFILAWPEGNGHLVERMLATAELGDRLHHPAAAYRIDPDAGEVLVHDFGRDEGIAFSARVVLWAAPRFVLPHLLPRPDIDPLDPAALSYAPWLVANLQLAEDPGGFGAALAWDNVPVLSGDGDVGSGPTNLGYVLANHSEPGDQRRPGAVITYYEPLSAPSRDQLRNHRASLLGDDLEATTEHVLRELERMHPSLRPKVEKLDIARWGHAMIRPAPGLLFGPQLRRARAPIGTILPCATDTAGLPLFEEAFYAGLRAAESALDRLGRADAALPG